MLACRDPRAHTRNLVFWLNRPDCPRERISSGIVMNRFSVSGRCSCDLMVSSGRCGTARIFRGGFDYSLDSRSKTDCVPQKQPPAKTAVCFPDVAARDASVVAGGIGALGAAFAV